MFWKKQKELPQELKDVESLEEKLQKDIGDFLLDFDTNFKALNMKYFHREEKGFKVLSNVVGSPIKIYSDYSEYGGDVAAEQIWKELISNIQSYFQYRPINELDSFLNAVKKSVLEDFLLTPREK